MENEVIVGCLPGNVTEVHKRVTQLGYTLTKKAVERRLERLYVNYGFVYPDKGTWKAA